ncbi:hypothetical protein FXE87_06895 [Vibrio mimicus]|nr:hypothetical protein FXE87_06895 [Vibrio mimicus]
MLTDCSEHFLRDFNQFIFENSYLSLCFIDSIVTIRVGYIILVARFLARILISKMFHWLSWNACLVADVAILPK